MIDRSLNWGREQVDTLLRNAAPFSSVLDIGAGAGADLACARAIEPQARRFAVESYAPNVERLRQMDCAVFALNIERESLPLGPQSIDVVIANQLLEHIKETFWMMHEVSRVLKVGGKFLLGVPNLASLHNRLLLAFGKQPTSIQNSSAHVRGYTRHDLLRFFETVFPGGYELQGFLGSNYYPLPPQIARPVATLLPNSAVSIFLLLEKKIEYQRQFLDFPRQKRLETNFFLGDTDGQDYVV